MHFIQAKGTYCRKQYWEALKSYVVVRYIYSGLWVSVLHREVSSFQG
jgi:hypothetical protein